MTREEILTEMRFIEGDLTTFRKAMSAMSGRKLELEQDPPRLQSFMEWPGTQALLNVLIMVISRCEGLLEDYRKLLDEAEMPNNVILLKPKGEEDVIVPK
jgi:hypothetical protein